MKIGVIFYKYPLYPQGSYFQEFLNKMAQSLEEVYLIATQYPKGNFKKPKNIKILWVPRLNIRFLDELFFMLAVLFKAIFNKELHQVNLVDVIGPRGLLAGWYLKKRHNIPLVCTIELLNEEKDIVNTSIYWLSRLLISKAPIDKIICWSFYYWENHLRKWGISKKKVVIIPAGIDTNVYHPKIDGSEIKKKYAPNNPLIVFAKPLYSPNTEAAKLLIRSMAILKSEIKIKVFSLNLNVGGRGNPVYFSMEGFRVWGYEPDTAHTTPPTHIVNLSCPCRNKRDDFPNYVESQRDTDCQPNQSTRTGKEFADISGYTGNRAVRQCNKSQH